MRARRTALVPMGDKVAGLWRRLSVAAGDEEAAPSELRRARSSFIEGPVRLSPGGYLNAAVEVVLREAKA